MLSRQVSIDSLLMLVTRAEESASLVGTSRRQLSGPQPGFAARFRRAAQDYRSAGRRRRRRELASSRSKPRPSLPGLSSTKLWSDRSLLIRSWLATPSGSQMATVERCSQRRNSIQRLSWSVPRVVWPSSRWAASSKRARTRSSPSSTSRRTCWCYGSSGRGRSPSSPAS